MWKDETTVFKIDPPKTWDKITRHLKHPAGNFFHRHKEVQPNDIIVTMDVDAFIMTPQILDYIEQNPNHIAWLPRYEEHKDTVFYQV